MLFKKLVFLFLLQMATIAVSAQNNVDTLEQMLKDHPKVDTQRLLIWATLAKEYNKVDLDKSLQASDTVIRLGEILSLPGWIANAYNAKGAVYYLRGDFTQALGSFKSALAMARKINHKRRICQSLNNIAAIDEELGNYNEALASCFQVLEIYTQENQKDGIASALGNIGGLYLHVSNFPKALEYLQKALKINQEIDNQEQIRENYRGFTDIYIKLNDYATAIEYNKKSLQIDDESGNDQTKVIDLNSLADVLETVSDYKEAVRYRLQAQEIAEKMELNTQLMETVVALEYDYTKLQEYSKALDYHLKAKALREKVDANVDDMHYFINAGYLYLNVPPKLLALNGFDSSSRYKLAIDYLQNGLDKAAKKKRLDLQSTACEYLSLAFQKQGDYQRAFDAFQQHTFLRDSIINDTKKKQVTRLEIQYEFSKKEDSLKLQQQLSDEKLKQQMLLSKQQQQQLQLRSNELTLANKEKDIQRLAYLKTQADLQNEQLQKQQKIKQLTLSEKEKELQASQLTTLSQEKKLNKLSQQRLWLLAAGGFSIVVFTALFFLYRTRLRQLHLASQLVQQKNEQQINEAEFQHKLGDITLSALRSQMNPHFIFNCLNSIKLYAAQNDSKAASDYLTKFSKLIRQMLENSRSDRISLSNEIQSLELYIQMEAMRFKEKLQYRISVDKNIDADYIEIPPLLIQPYVENAIWHGLMQKEEGGHIAIQLSHLSNNDHDDMLVATVTDNGIGRKKATEIKSKSATRHKSYGMKVTSERIALINQVYNSNTTVEVTDLYDEFNEACGTRVVIQIPI